MMNDGIPHLPPRHDGAYKSDFGLALIVSGSRGMAGAVALAGLAGDLAAAKLGQASMIAILENH